MSEVNVIPGILKKVFTEKSTSPFNVQISNFKEVFNESGKRLRFILSDGEYSCHSICRPEDAAKIEALGVQKSTILQLTGYTAESMGSGDKKKYIVVINDGKVIKPTYSKIGNGKSIGVDDYFKQHPSEVAHFEDDAPSKSITPAGPTSQSKQPAATGNSTFYKSNQNKPENLFPIDQLSPYQNHWTIKARVSYKSPLKTWKNAKGEGTLFSVNLLDETNEIKATAFNDTATRLYDVLQEGKVFYILKARVQQARAQFATLSHPYEISFDRDTEVTECEDAGSVPKLTYSFIPLSKIEELEVNSVIDVIGVIKQVDPAFQITSKSTGKNYDRRDIVIVDESKFLINLGLWNKMAVDFSIPTNSVVAVKGARIQDFGGRSLSLSQSGTISANPDIPEAFKLKGWYDTQGSQISNFKSIKTEATGKSIDNDRKTIREVQAEGLGTHEKPDYFNLKATVTFLKNDTFSYPACSTEGCNRKVIEQPDGTWRCEKCDTNFPEPNHRYIMSCSVADYTGNIWVTLFDDAAKVIFNGTDANELIKLRDDPDAANNGQFENLFKDAQMQEYNFRISARQDTYNETTRIRYQAQAIAKLNYNSECDLLISSLDSMNL